MNRLGVGLAAGALCAVALGACGLLLVDGPPGAPCAAGGSGRVLADGRPPAGLTPEGAAPIAPSIRAPSSPAATRPSARAGRRLAEPRGTWVGRSGTRRSPEAGPAAPAPRSAHASASAAEGSPPGERLETRLRGRVLDDRGLPLADVLVASRAPAARTHTDTDGGFELLLERAAGPGHAGLVIQARAAGFETAQRVLVSQEAELELELTLTPRFETAALTVFVFDAYGRRRPQQRVHVTPDGSVDTYSSPTLDDGTCRLSSLPPGPVWVWVRETPDGEPTVQRRLQLEPGENRIDLRPTK